MPPRKTPLAVDALQAHRGPLDLRQRRLLILADGHREVAELTALLGPDTPARIAALCQAGYLALDVPSPSPSPSPAPLATASAPPASAAPGTPGRRSLVAARLYVLGMLELLRQSQAQALHRQLQACRDEDATVAVLAQVLAQLPAMTSAGYADRVRQRVAEVLPPACLPRLALA
ncbi:hypothetical protein [Xanthomonas massiliensis]|uniref:hypothetical protein n=1 Tax=Xanthomonas massiliensis TaxID=1720302 RepID=UPI00082680A0|nr:hypothetical protein [Xanthomonas massiliensis]